MPVLKIEEIKKLIPHRYPFLLVDRVLEVDKNHIVSIKNVSVNEQFFNGHFEDRPLMPGVLQVEALAQSACIMIMEAHVDNVEENLIVFSAIKSAKFRRSVVPGDQLRMEINLSNKRRNFITMGGQATVDGNVACELEATAAIVPREES